MAKRPQEIRFAVFGAKNSGKTTMLAAYFGSQQTEAFIEDRGYRLSADNTSDGNSLLAHYHRLEDGVFPPSSSNVHDYRFSFFVKGLAEPSFRIEWTDYPGGWWEREPKDPGEKAARDTMIQSLLGSHACLFLIDGEKFVAEGQRYVRHALDQFKNEAKKISNALSPDCSDKSIPSNWIIAVTKADLLPEGTTAAEISREILKGAADSVSGLAKILHAENLGTRVLLLSSVAADGQKITDPCRQMGFTMIAPAVLLSTLEDVQQKADSGKAHRAGIGIVNVLRTFFQHVDRLDDFLPEKYQFITLILGGLQLDEALGNASEALQKRQDIAVKKKRYLEAGINAIRAEVASPDARKVYHQLLMPAPE